MTETTTEQLAEIEGQAADTPVPDGWRLLASGETLQEGDQWIRPWDGRWISVCVGSHAAVSGGQYIRQIASEPDWQAEEIQYLQREMSTLQKQLEAVKAELVTQAETSRRLQIELDAAQQVPQAIADRFEEGWNQGTARAIETVLEWLQPIRAVDNEHLANETLQHLPQIMRSLTGLAQD